MRPPSKVICPECTASLPGMSCYECLGGIIAWEYQDPDLFQLHFVTVASYNLQHPAQYTEEAIAGLRSAYLSYLDGHVSIAEIRQGVGRAFAGQHKVRKAAGEQVYVQRPWSMTIADVYLPNQPQGAADRVRAWATATRNEL